MSLKRNYGQKKLFEYLVFRLNEWKINIEQSNINVPVFTKLRLQKILFLVCSWKATKSEHKLLDVFDNFYALPYGPVEMDIYEAMKSNKTFQHIYFEGNKCVYPNLEESMFASLSGESRKWIDEAIDDFIQDQRCYLTMPVFDLVDITHRWTAWNIMMNMAEFLGNKKEEMSTECICNSTVKVF